MTKIQYEITAYVNGVMVFNKTYDDTAILQEELYKPEMAVEKAEQAMEDE